MEKYYLLDYLKKNNPVIAAKLDLLKYELDQRIYYYGQHFKCPKEKSFSKDQKFLYNLKYYLKTIYTFYLIFKTLKNNGSKTIISNAYFSVNKKLADAGLNILRPIHSLDRGKLTVCNLKILTEFVVIDQKIRNADFNELLSGKFLKKLDSLTEHLTEYYKSIGVDALIVPNDISFYEQLNIQIFKKMGKPSFIFLHGLPGRYNIYDDNQTDYLVVWGEKIKQHYIKVGFNPDKIIVSGHPFYEQLSVEPLRSSLIDVLVISKALDGAQFRDRVRHADRGNIIVYLNQIADSLKLLGVKKARLRVHPSENVNWYLKFIDRDFFVADKESLVDSLKKSTLVIGPTSTVFLESIYYGVNYLVYEPTVNNINFSDYLSVPPFDGSDPKVPVANNETDLKKLLIEKTIVDKTVFNDYVSMPFNVNRITDLI